MNFGIVCKKVVETCLKAWNPPWVNDSVLIFCMYVTCDAGQQIKVNRFGSFSNTVKLLLRNIKHYSYLQRLL
jgi:hypothetical protein